MPASSSSSSPDGLAAGLRRDDMPVLGIIQVILPMGGQRAPQLTEDEVARIGSTWTRIEEKAADGCGGTEELAQDVCGICLSDFHSGEELTALPCASSGGCLSVWHAGCIRKWLCQGQSQSCPLCRTNFNLDGTPGPLEPPSNEFGSTTFSVGILGNGPALPADIIHDLIFLSMLPSRANRGDPVGDNDLGGMGLAHSGAGDHGLSQMLLSLRSDEISVMRLREDHSFSMSESVTVGGSATTSQWSLHPVVASEEESGAQNPPPPSDATTPVGHVSPDVGVPTILRGSSGMPRGPRGGAGPVRQPLFPAFTEPRPLPAGVSRSVRSSPGGSLGPSTVDGEEVEDLDEHLGGPFRTGSVAMPFPRGIRSPGGFMASSGLSSPSTVWGAPRVATVVGPASAPPSSSWSARLASEWLANRMWNAMPRGNRP